jgi:hypothetical protein
MGKRTTRPNLGGSLRPRTGSPRNSFLYIEATEAERQAIYDCCAEKSISVSQFLADLLLEEAAKPKAKGKVVVRAALELTHDESDKLELLARLSNKQSVDEFIRDLIQPQLDMQKLHTDLKTMPLRFYLSEEEHAIITGYMEAKGVPARKYATVLAMRVVAKARKRRR